MVCARIRWHSMMKMRMEKKKKKEKKLVKMSVKHRTGKCFFIAPSHLFHGFYNALFAGDCASILNV